MTEPSYSLTIPVSCFHNDYITADECWYVLYTNHKGDTSYRNIIPLYIHFGSTQYHPNHGFLLEARDVKTYDICVFALKDMQYISTRRIEDARLHPITPILKDETPTKSTTVQYDERSIRDAAKSIALHPINTEDNSTEITILLSNQKMFYYHWIMQMIDPSRSFKTSIDEVKQLRDHIKPNNTPDRNK